MDELKPCPFCGGYVRFESSSAIYNRRIYGECLQCGMEFAYQEEYEEILNSSRVLYVPTKEVFENAWNRRADNG